MPRARASHSLWDEIQYSRQTSYCNCIERRVFLHYISLCCIYINMTFGSTQKLLEQRNPKYWRITTPKYWRAQEKILYAEKSKLENYYCDRVKWCHPIKLVGLKRHNDQYFVDMADDIMRMVQDRTLEFSAYYYPLGVPWREACDEWEGRTHLIFHCDFAQYSDEFLDFVRTHPEMKVVVFSCHYLPGNTPSLKNLRIVHWGSDYLIQKEEYQNVDAVEKSFATDYHWISLSHRPRLHRWMAALYLKGLGLDTTGRLSISKQPITSIYHPNSGIDITNWRVPYQHEWTLTLEQDNSYGSILDLGFERISKHNINPPAPGQIYITPNGNAENLNLRLRPLYTNTAVEIVNETIFNFDLGIHMTEKFINSVYGMNLPIVQGQPGIIKYCRELGFDMFDDVIDQSYDLVVNPMERLAAAIDRNRRLLEDRDFAIASWHRCRLRLHANYELARYRLHDQVYNRVMSEVPAALDFLS